MLEELEQTIIFSLRHENYTASMEMDAWCKSVLNDEGQKDYIKAKTKDQLTDLQLQKALNIYRPATGEALNPIQSLYERMHQSDGITITLESESESFNNAVKEYYRSSTLTEYLQKNFVRWNFECPNAWLITERADVRTNRRIEQIKNYPLLITSDQAINYKLDNQKNVEWLIVLQKRNEVTFDKGVMNKEEVEDYLMYGIGRAIAYREHVNAPIKGDAKVLEVAGRKRTFAVTDIQTGTQHFSGGIIGVLGDDVKHPPYWKARNVLNDIIIHKFWLDAIEKAHVFPRKWQFAPVCDHVDEELGSCEGGYYNGIQDDSHVCKSCRGTRVKIHKSALDVMLIPYPKGVSASELPKLPDMVYYEQIETEAVQHYGKQLDKDFARLPISIFSVQVAESPNPLQIKTATEIEAERQDTNTAVLKIANGFSRCWEVHHRAIAEYHAAESVIKHSFAPDLKLETLGQLINRLSVAKGANMDSSIVHEIECDIIAKENANNPNAVQKFKIRRKLLPFPFQSKDEIQLIINERGRTDRDVMLHQNQHRIFTNIDDKFPEFYTMSFDRQNEIIDREIEALDIVYVETTQPLVFE